MAYRTTRAFRDQYSVLVLSSQLRRAEDAADDDPNRHPWRARRVRRQVEARSAALAVALESPSLQRLPEAELLRDVRKRLETPRPAEEAARPTVTSPNLWRAAIAAWALAWLSVLGEVAIGGVANRPALVASQLTAIALSTLLLWLYIRSGPGSGSS